MNRPINGGVKKQQQVQRPGNKGGKQQQQQQSTKGSTGPLANRTKAQQVKPGFNSFGVKLPV